MHKAGAGGHSEVLTGGKNSGGSTFSGRWAGVALKGYVGF